MPDKSQDTNIALGYLERHFATEDVVTMGKQVQALIDHPGWQVVTDILAKRREDVRNQIEQGIHQHVEYANSHGYLRGLAVLSGVADAVIEAGKRADAQLQAFLQEQTAQEKA